MRQFLTIAYNAFMELVRQPVFLLLMTSSAVFIVFLATPYYFAFGDEPKLVKNSGLAVMLLAGLLSAVLSSSASLAPEIRSGTALAVLSKPVSRAGFVLAKYAGLVVALTVLTYVNCLALLIASRMSFDVYGSTDLNALWVFLGGLVLAYAVAGFANYFLRVPFVSFAVIAVLTLVTLAAFVIIQFTTQRQSLYEAAQVDWRLVPASVLVLLALCILAALALACSTRLDMIPTLAICSAAFLLGLMSDYLFGRSADGGAWWAAILYSLTPNWQLFWVADLLETGKSGFPWIYVGKALIYVFCYVGALLAVAVALFEDRELS